MLMRLGDQIVMRLGGSILGVEIAIGLSHLAPPPISVRGMDSADLEYPIPEVRPAQFRSCACPLSADARLRPDQVCATGRNRRARSDSVDAPASQFAIHGPVPSDWSIIPSSSQV